MEVSDGQQISDLQLSSSKTQYLQDEVSILKRQNEDLRRKANTAENYRKKVVQLKDIETEVQDLRAELEAAKAEAKSAKEARIAAELDSQNCHKTMATVEQENYQLQLIKNRLEVDHKNMLVRWEDMNEDRLKDTEEMSYYQAQIAGLEAQLRDLEAEQKTQRGPPRTLEAELQEEADQDS